MSTVRPGDTLRCITFHSSKQRQRWVTRERLVFQAGGEMSEAAILEQLTDRIPTWLLALQVLLAPTANVYAYTVLNERTLRFIGDLAVPGPGLGFPGENPTFVCANLQMFSRGFGVRAAKHLGGISPSYVVDGQWTVLGLARQAAYAAAAFQRWVWDLGRAALEPAIESYTTYIPSPINQWSIPGNARSFTPRTVRR